jgi:uncharacterized repeat protein (TIGR01451 family)
LFPCLDAAWTIKSQFTRVASIGAVPKEGIESMGRRLLLVFGVALAAASTPSVTSGQDPDANAPPPQPTPIVAPADPATIPEEVKLPIVPPGADPDELATPESVPSQEKKKARPRQQQPATADDPTAKFGALLEGFFPKPEPKQPRTDENVVRVQAPAPPPAPSPATAGADAPPAAPVAATADTARPTVDRLPLGKQSVAVTVDVQGPASMNRNQEATLKLLVRNTGTSDALNVDVQDELPEGLQYISSQPEMHVTADSHLSLRINNLPAGSDRVITIRVKPTKTGPFDHAATVRFETGCKSRTRVLEPKLKVDIIANPTVAKVLKGQSVEFKVTITNTGDGPARNVAIQAKLSAGLRHESGQRSDEQMLYELSLPELMPGQSEKLDPLVADAVVGGDQTCTVVAKSPDVIFIKEDAENTKTISVVEPKLKLTLKGPDSRYTETIGDYEIMLENPGTAPARRLRVLATLPVSGRLVQVPPDAKYDNTTRRLYWSVDQIDAGAKPMVFPFQVRMGGIGHYQLLAEATGDGSLKSWGRHDTEVMGMPDVDLVVSEAKRVLDVGGTTTFQIRLRNYGTKEATNLQISAELSKNLQVEQAGGGPKDVRVAMSPEKDKVKFEEITKLGPGKEIVLGILVRVVADQPRLATCRVFVTHDDLTERFEDMAGVKVTSTRSTAAGRAGE